MAKELPYFRFTVQDWQNGKVTLESYELQGLFINICGYYWINDCDLTLAMLQKKFSNATASVLELIELDIIKHESRHDKVEIVFLNNQYDLLSEKRKRRQDAGSKGGNATAMLKQKGSYKDKDKDKDNNKDKELALPFDSENFVKVWNVLKRQPKWKKKSIDSLQAALKKLSNHTEGVAIQMMENTIGGNWQGLFELKEKTNFSNGTKSTESKHDSIRNAVEEAKRLNAENCAQSYAS